MLDRTANDGADRVCPKWTICRVERIGGLAKAIERIVRLKHPASPGVEPIRSLTRA